MHALPAAMEQWLAYLKENRRYSPHTLGGYRQDLHHLTANHPGAALETLTEAHIRQTVARLHAGATSRAAWRGACQPGEVYQWWAPQAGMKANPVKGVRAPKIPRGLPKALSVEQAQVLLDRPGQPLADDPIARRDQAMFEVLYSSGLRVAELVSLDRQPVRRAATIR